MISTDSHTQQPTWAHLSVVLDSKVESESGDSLSLGSGGNLQALHDAWETRVLESRVLSLGVLSDDGKVDVVVPGLEAWQGLADGDRGIDVELLPDGNVPRVVAGLVDGRVEDT